jgi:hypothetical protein
VRTLEAPSLFEANAAIDDRLVQIVKEYQTTNHPDFAVLWFPANMPIGSYPITGKSLIVSLIRFIEVVLSPQQNRLLPPL